MLEKAHASFGGIESGVRWLADSSIPWRLLGFYGAVVLVQTAHVVEHVIQLVQVYLLGVPDELALGLLGYALAIQGTEEWLHLAFNALYLAGLTIIALGLLRWPLAARAVPRAVLVGFLFFGIWLEAWHVLEHVVIISGVIANDGCPCPGIIDARLGVSDTVLHFGYNAAAYVATVLPFACVVRFLLRSHDEL